MAWDSGIDRSGADSETDRLAASLLDQLVALRRDVVRGVMPSGQQIACSNATVELLVSRLEDAIATAEELVARVDFPVGDRLAETSRND
jgi:hypothetical protein